VLGYLGEERLSGPTFIGNESYSMGLGCAAWHAVSPLSKTSAELQMRVRRMLLG